MGIYTKLERLRFLDSALSYHGVMIGDGKQLLPQATFNRMVKDRQDLIVEIAAFYGYETGQPQSGW